MKTILYILIALMAGIFPARSRAQVAPVQISQKRLQKSVNEVLGTKSSVSWEKIPIPVSVKKLVSKQLKIKSSLPDTLYLGKVGTDKGARYIIPDIAPSKSRKFSYVLYLNPKKEIMDVDVLEYRENYGYEIDYPFFRKQFQGKRKPNELRFGRTIQNISGATISARSLTYSVHDLLALMQQITLKQ